MRPPPTREANPARGGDGEPGTGGLSVLLVDDDALVRDGTAGMLEDLGHAVIEAESGRRALDILRGGRAVDVVVTDQAMPGMSGVQLAAAIAAERPGVPVLLASGYAELPDDVCGAVAERLTKPFGQDRLAAALARATGAARAGNVVPLPGRDTGQARTQP